MYYITFMPLSPDLLSLPLIALYAETHFRFFPFFPSLLFRRQPEVLFDLPKRLDPSSPDLPVVLIANDVHRFPATLSNCSLVVSAPHQTQKRFDFSDITQFETAHPLHKSMKCFLLRIPRAELPIGLVHITATVTVKQGKRSRVVMNDNFPGTQKFPFSCYIAEERLPGADLSSFGDLHVHSLYSQSHVEFGPPVRVIDEMTKANGMDFCAITDHSYDLACTIDNYHRPDPTLARWRAFLAEFDKKGGFQSIVIPGEEVSCLNDKGEVVHLCGIGIADFLPGNLDGARVGRGKDPQLSLPVAIQKIHDQGGIAVAAHPGARMGFLQRLFLWRGNWSATDMSNPLDGVQIMNTGISPLFSRGKTLWIEQLLAGRKMPVLAGNDAHGDFNRYRAITTPFVSIGDRLDRFFGNGRTGLYGSPRSECAILDAIRQGRTFVTTGPFITLSANGNPGESIVSHSPISAEIKRIVVHARSSEEFGAIKRIRLYSGQREAESENLVFSKSYNENSSISIDEEIDLNTLKNGTIYLRTEVECAGEGKQPCAAFTSPVYRE